MTSIDDAREAREEIIETQRILEAYERAERRSEKEKLSEDAYTEAMHSRFDLKWFSLDDEAGAAGDLMKAVEKLMFAVHVGWSYHPQHPSGVRTWDEATCFRDHGLIRAGAVGDHSSAWAAMLTA